MGEPETTGAGTTLAAAVWWNGDEPGRLTIADDRIVLELELPEDEKTRDKIAERTGAGDGAALPAAGTAIAVIDAPPGEVEWKWRWSSRNTIHKFSHGGHEWKLQYHGDREFTLLGDPMRAGEMRRMITGGKSADAVRERLEAFGRD